MPTYVALLRGINLGPRKKIAMPALRDLCEELGHTSVTTYIQSGNVVFSSSVRSPAKVGSELSAAIAETFGHEITVVMRTPKQLEAVVENNPFLEQGASAKELHVAFLADKATATLAKRLDPERAPGDAFEVRGQEIYLRYPNGMGRSKLTNDYLERRLAMASTVRNWNTVTKLLELSRGS